jgi:hypothetical protein
MVLVAFKVITSSNRPAVKWPVFRTALPGFANWKVAGSRPYQVNDFFSSSYLILTATLDPEVHSASNRNEYQKLKNNVPGE